MQAAAPQGSGSAPHWQPTFQKLLTGRCFCFASAACDSALRYEPKRWATPRTRGLAKFDSTPLSAAMKALKPQKAAAPRTRHPGIAACCKACPCSKIALGAGRAARVERHGLPVRSLPPNNTASYSPKLPPADIQLVLFHSVFLSRGQVGLNRKKRPNLSVENDSTSIGASPRCSAMGAGRPSRNRTEPEREMPTAALQPISLRDLLCGRTEAEAGSSGGCRLCSGREDR